MIQSLEGIDLIDRLREMSNRVRQRVDNVKSEEATKTALVMPFINHVLGYNVFDPSEVVPEFVADVGTKKGEKVDYAIFSDGEPIMLFECKNYGVDLGREPASQLYRYFSVAAARFGVLTDGVVYRFYSDIDEQNKMDARPFLEINMLDIDAVDVHELKRFTKASFDLGQILNTAKDLKYTREVLRLLAAEWDNPSEALVRHFASQVYNGVKTKAVIEQFTRATKKALHQFVAKRISDRLKSALASTGDETPDEQKRTTRSQAGTGPTWVALSDYDPPTGTSPPAALRFWDGELREDLNHWYDIFLSIAEKLYAEQRLKIGDLPLTLGRRTSYCIHTEPVGPNAQRFQAFRSIAEGKLLVNTHGSAKSMRNLSGNLLEHYDLTPADVQVLIRTPTHSPAATA